MDILEVDALYRRKVTAHAKSQFLKLLPFLASSIGYFILSPQEPSLLGAVVKCLPVLSLAFYVAGESRSAGVGAWTPYAQRIFSGLLLSVVGDACLVWPQLFIPGMLAFAGCHISYILAFGLRPFNPLVYLVVAAFMVSDYTLLQLPCLKGFYVVAVAIYSSLLGVMAWRALSRPNGQLSASVGSVFFIVSDTFVGLDTFCHSVRHPHLISMSTYYIAQGLIARSVASDISSKKES
ncbi:lysoplasmalogenase TMEM86B [Elgaria multicarinata webbii]|uniref:lysoplasmalogenase TMEM86B n=1 Tax=Elgaria multicarinata webbii TaxID=159646 RepID=UPI002FCD3C0F